MIILPRLPRHLVNESLVHGGLSPRLHELRVNREPEAAGEANRPEDAQGIVQQGFDGRQRRAHETQLKVIRALTRKVFHHTSVDVVEHGVYGKISGGELGAGKRG